MSLRRIRILVPVLVVTLATFAVLAAPAAAGESRSDKAILKAGIITKDDVPAGWTSEKARGDSSSFRGIAECRRIKSAVDKARKNVPRARSRQFQDPTTDGGTSAESTVYAFKYARAATGFLANYQDPGALPCFEKSLATSRGGPTVSPITDLQGVGDEAVGYEITSTAVADGQPVTVYVDFVAVRVGRAFLGFAFSNGGERIPNGPEIVRAVVARVTDAEAGS